jgi:hypothetical protein
MQFRAIIEMRGRDLLVQFDPKARLGRWDDVTVFPLDR